MQDMIQLEQLFLLTHGSQDQHTHLCTLQDQEALLLQLLLLREGQRRRLLLLRLVVSHLPALMVLVRCC